MLSTVVDSTKADPIGQVQLNYSRAKKNNQKCYVRQIELLVPYTFSPTCPCPADLCTSTVVVGAIDEQVSSGVRRIAGTYGNTKLEPSKFTPLFPPFFTDTATKRPAEEEDIDASLRKKTKT